MEYVQGIEHGKQGGKVNDIPTNERKRRTQQASKDYDTVMAHSAAMSVTATAESADCDDLQWSSSATCPDCQDNNDNSYCNDEQHLCSNHDNNDGDDDNDNEATSTATRCNVMNEVVDCENRNNAMTETTMIAANPNSWMRASMRRLRHLRLPDNTQRVTNDESINRPVIILSAPNSLPDIALIAPEILAAQTNGTNTSDTLLRPSSAPARNAVTGNGISRRTGRQLLTNRSQRVQSHEVSSRQDSIDSTTMISDITASNNTTCSSSFSSSTTTPSSIMISSQHATPSVFERQRNIDSDNGVEDNEDENSFTKWPHAYSSVLAYLGCTLGLFNINRFAIMSVQFGANFIVQFVILSFVLGIPLLTLQICLGQRLSAGSIDMWRISPLFQGIGIALLTAQAFIGIYSIIGVSWMFVYFRDSFIIKTDKYRWLEPYRDDSRPMHNSTTLYRLYETVPDYFNSIVLQRHHLNESNFSIVTLKFQIAFNLAIVWMIIFVSLSKGLRSYGKVVYVFTLPPLFGILLLCTKLFVYAPSDSVYQLFPNTVWSEFFINGKSWVAASSEVFLTWGLFGAAAMQIAAHNKHKHFLQRDTSLLIILTFVILLLGAFLANTCVQILRHYGYIYISSSFERLSEYTFVRLANQSAPSRFSNIPERFMSHASFLLGHRVRRPGIDMNIESGYQVLRLATELVPSTLALLGTDQISPFWAILFYFILIFFGIAQQLAIWHCVITGIMAINKKIMKLWGTTITLFSCACAYILGLPMITELGIYVVYYLDYTIGGAWWIIVLYLIQIAAVFAFRGRPYTGETIVAELFPSNRQWLRYWASPLLSFTWNVILPVTLMVLSIAIFKNGDFRELYSYRHKHYWTVWARQLGAAIQLTPIFMILIVAIIQAYRYLNSGPPDIFDRIQLLYRPPLEPDNSHEHIQIAHNSHTSSNGSGILPITTTEIPFEDPPPKYTPPPSYTTATGARIAKILRQSFRRSIRRIANALGEGSISQQRAALQPSPPDYATVLIEMNQNDMSLSHDHIAISELSESQPDMINVNDSRHNTRISLIEHNHQLNAIEDTNRISNTTRPRIINRTHLSIDRNRQSDTNTTTQYTSSSSNVTGIDVVNLLRSSIRRGSTRIQQSRSLGNEESITMASDENLIETAAPIGEDSLILLKDIFLVSDEQVNDCHDNENHNDKDIDEKKIANVTEVSVSST